MKLVCDSCGTRYSLADDKIAGKVCRIRCKKCGFVMVARGSAPEAAPAPSGAWHAVVHGEHAGPFDRDELARKRASGELDDASLVWREGMADWTALGGIDELRAPEPPADDAPKLRGERNETSVLFTLGNLAKLAAPAPVRAAPAAGDEGSGLIDIRRLAGTLAPPVARPAAGSADDLPSDAPAGFGEPIVLVPPPRRTGIDRRLVIALAAMVAMLAIVTTVLVVVLAREPTADARAVTSPPPRVAAVEPVGARPPDVHAPVRAQPPDVHEPPAPPPDGTPVPARVPLPSPRPARASSTRTPRASAANPLVGHDDCSEVTCVVNGYADPCCAIYKHADPTSTTRVPPATLPDNLDRAALAKGIASIPAQACGARSPAKGDVHVSVKVSADGAVASVAIKSSPDATLSACVTAAAHKGRFPASKRGGSFAYLWRF